MIKIGLLGLGTVGSGVVKIMEKNGDNIRKKVGTELEIKKILVKNKEKKRKVELKRNILTSDPDNIIMDPEIDLVVELIGGENPALEYIINSINY